MSEAHADLRPAQKSERTDTQTLLREDSFSSRQVPGILGVSQEVLPSLFFKRELVSWNPGTTVTAIIFKWSENKKRYWAGDKEESRRNSKYRFFPCPAFTHWALKGRELPGRQCKTRYHIHSQFAMYMKFKEISQEKVSCFFLISSLIYLVGGGDSTGAAGSQLCSQDNLNTTIFGSRATPCSMWIFVLQPGIKSEAQSLNHWTLGKSFNTTFHQILVSGTSRVVLWLSAESFHCRRHRLIFCLRTKILHTTWQDQKKIFF